MQEFVKRIEWSWVVTDEEKVDYDSELFILRSQLHELM